MSVPSSQPSSSQRVLLAHPGTQHAFRLARELDRLGLLGEFWTGLALRERGLTARLTDHIKFVPGLKGLASRVARQIDPAKLHTLPGNELRALWRLRRGHDSEAVIHERNRAFQAAIPAASLQRHKAVIGFDTSSWQIAARAHELGRPFLLDRTIAHPAYFSRLRHSLQQKYPAWFPPLAARPPAVTQAEAEEHALAQMIVVGSSFARETLLLEGIPAEKIRVNGYGVDWRRFASPALPVGMASNRPLRFIFLGSIIARKGIPVLLDAWRALGAQRGEAELWLVGSCDPDLRRLLPSLPGLKVLGRVPHQEVPALLSTTDVFVLPSLLEGFSLAMLEAIASGLPVIATPNTGAADALLAPILGRTIPAGDVEALADSMVSYIRQPPDRVAVIQASAPLAIRYSWESYARRWRELLATL